MKQYFLSLAVVIAALFLTTSCQNKSQNQTQNETGQVNNFRIKRGTNVSHWPGMSKDRSCLRPGTC